MRHLKSQRRFAMHKPVLVLTTSAVVLACGIMAASAQQSQPGTPENTGTMAKKVRVAAPV
jgi:hypothetical protein